MENPRYKGVYLDGPKQGEEFTDWKSRSVAVVAAVIIDRPGETLSLLMGKRGKNCPDNIGKWCIPCGYVGWDETLREAASRELFEETGIKISPDKFTLGGFEDSPTSNRQNITMRFFTIVHSIPKFDTDSGSRGGEDQEYSEISVFSIDKILSMSPKDFAFDHDRLSASLLDEFDRIKKNQAPNFIYGNIK